MFPKYRNIMQIIATKQSDSFKNIKKPDISFFIFSWLFSFSFVLFSLGNLFLLSIETLCRLSQLSKATVLKTLKSLEEKKAIKVEHRKDKNNKTISNFYTIYDYQELWNAESIEQIKETIDIEELQLFELAKKKGYVLTKENSNQKDHFQ